MATAPGTYARFTTSMGEFLVRFFDKEAPNTVANFVGLAEGSRRSSTTAWSSTGSSTAS
jgi:peptidyl-prolyl cis-trans isomerase A (cyclophilin A)